MVGTSARFIAAAAWDTGSRVSAPTARAFQVESRSNLTCPQPFLLLGRDPWHRPQSSFGLGFQRFQPDRTDWNSILHAAELRAVIPTLSASHACFACRLRRPAVRTG